MPWLDETFANPTLDLRLRWLNSPPEWHPGRDGLVVRTDANTDFWQGTHYGFRVDNGHLLASEVEGDFVLETLVQTTPLHQYDQAGLMVRLSEQCWLKTSVEFEPGESSRLGAVVTNAGWSDWSTRDLDPEAGRRVAFRVTRRGADYTVETAFGPEAPWTQIRLARLHEDAGGPVTAGLYACSPKDAGFTAVFKHLRIDRR